MSRLGVSDRRKLERKVEMEDNLILYLCDPEKNKECKKTGCFTRYQHCCEATNKAECAVLDNEGKPIRVFFSDDPGDYNLYDANGQKIAPRLVPGAE